LDRLVDAYAADRDDLLSMNVDVAAHIGIIAIADEPEWIG
jgi:hypothetical protein